MKRLLLVLSFLCFPALSQEVFFKDQEYLYDLPPEHFYLYGQGEQFEISKDYITKDDKYSAIYNHPDAVVRKTGRNYHKDTSIGFTHEDAKLIIPDTVTKDIIDKDNGFTITGWFYISDISEDRTVAYIGSESTAKIEILLHNRKLIVRKKSNLVTDRMVPVIETAFPLEIDGQIPVAGDITNGYFYLALSTDKNSTRVYLSRPGGRLYSQWFYFGLVGDISYQDKIYFGRSPSADETFKVMESYSNLMIYLNQLSSNDVLNAFYIQSPLYPGVSYRFTDSKLRDLTPTNWDNQSGKFDEDGPFIWRKLDRYYNGTLSSTRWFIESRTIGQSRFIPVNLRNARTGGYIYQKVGSNYYHQLLFPAENYPERTAFHMEKLEDNPTSLYTVSGQKHIKFWSAYEPAYWLGENSDYLYLDDNEENGRWGIRSAIKVYHGAESIIPSQGHRVKLRNLSELPGKDKGARMYMNMYSGSNYYYAKLDKYSVSNPDISNVVDFYLELKSRHDYGIYNKYSIRKVGDYEQLQPYNGKTDKTNNDYVITYDNRESKDDFYWEMIKIDTPMLDKKEVGDRNFYAIRASNGYGSFLLGRKDSFCPGGSSICYVLKSGAGAYDSDGTPKRDFLWVIDYKS
ncbi:hypothetical protein CMV60_05575 [Serratia marcescens]|nr:hypothetical protein CMV60_05575 [Serratia marcescens]